MRIRSTGFVKSIYFIVIMLVSIIISEIILFTYFKYIVDILYAAGVSSLMRLLILLSFLFTLITLGWKKRAPQAVINSSLIDWIVPAWFHIYFFIWFFLAGFNHENNWMTFFAVANLIAGILLHAGNYIGKVALRRKVIF